MLLVGSVLEGVGGEGESEGVVEEGDSLSAACMLSSDADPLVIELRFRRMAAEKPLAHTWGRRQRRRRRCRQDYVRILTSVDAHIYTHSQVPYFMTKTTYACTCAHASPHTYAHLHACTDART